MYLEIILTLILLVMLSFPIMIIILWFKIGKKVIKNFSEIKDSLKQPRIELPKVEPNSVPASQTQTPPQIPDLGNMMEVMGKLGQMFGNRK